MLNFLHFNARSVCNKIDLIDVFLNDVDPDIVCISETWLHENNLNIVCFPNYRLASAINRKLSIGGGVAILVKNYLNFNEINNIKNMSVESHCQCTGISMPSIKTNVIVLYRPPSGNFTTFQNIINEIFIELQYSNYKIIICEDFNLPFHDLNKVETLLMFDIIDIYKFTALIKTPTRVTKNGSSIIDNVITNFHLDNILYVNNVNVPFSDHRAQFVKFSAISASQTTKHTLIKKRYFTEDNILKF